MGEGQGQVSLGEVGYAVLDGQHVAYRTAGQGPPDVLVVADWFSNVEVMWEPGPLSDALSGLASFCRVVVFDKRGVGLSDPVGPENDGLFLETWADDVLAVLGRLGITGAFVVGVGAGGPMVLQFAATHPDRVFGLVLVNTYARLLRAPDYPAGFPERARDTVLAWSYTDTATADGLSGASATPAFQAWWRRYQRQSVSPGVANRMRRALFEVDVRSVLPAVRARTLVVHRTGDQWIREGHGRYLAEHLPNARFVPLPGDEDLFYLGDAETLIDHVRAFVSGTAPELHVERSLMTVMFVDLVQSTELLARVGDTRWRQLLEAYDRAVDETIERHQGRVLSRAGDGAVACFDAPSRALRCALSLRAVAASLGLHLRAGLHTGEVATRSNGDISGLAVHIASRVSAQAGDGEVLASRTVRDLVVGSGLSFEDRGVQALRGIPDAWQLYAVAD